MIMSSSGDFSVPNFQSLIENYETIFKDVTGELDAIQGEQISIKNALKENAQLRSDLNKVLAESANSEIEHKYKEGDLIENLEIQLQSVLEEKDHAIKLWQNATEYVEQLEGELRIYQGNTESLIPKSKLLEVKDSYEAKIKDLESTVAVTKSRLEQTLKLKSKELQIRDQEIIETIQSQDNTFKIVKNLEEEVLSLQKRLSEISVEKRKLEKLVKNKNDEVEAIRGKMKECTVKVEEALHVVDAAMKEKDAALLREAALKEETEKLSKNFSEFIDETDTRVQALKKDYDTKVEQMKQILQARQEEIKIKGLESENYAKRCDLLEQELERCQKSRVYVEEGSVTKLLSLEKSLEDTFQKLLLSEKQNIQLKSEVENIKSDLDQMARHYERDVHGREAEKTVLQNEVKRLKTELRESQLQVSQSADTVNKLNEKISTMEVDFKEQIDGTRTTFQETCKNRQEMETVHNQLVHELQDQLNSQTEINKKWRVETKIIAEQLEKVITELKMVNSRIKRENKTLHDKLKDSNLKILEYRKFLEMISKDVTKITNITLPDLGASDR